MPMGTADAKFGDILRDMPKGTTAVLDGSLMSMPKKTVVFFGNGFRRLGAIPVLLVLGDLKTP